MNTRTAANALRSTLTLLDKFESALPSRVRKTIDTGLEEYRIVTEWRPEQYHETHLIQSAYTALAAGLDPSEDPNVQKALLAERLTAVRSSVGDEAGERLGVLVREHIDQLVSALDGAYQRHAAEPLASHRDTLRRHGIDSPEVPSNVVFDLGPDAAAAWAGALAAEKAHHSILNTYTILRVGGGYPHGTTALLWIDPKDKGYGRVRALGSKPHPWKVLDAGMELSLTTPAGAQARQSRALELQQKADEQAMREADAATRRRYGREAVR